VSTEELPVSFGNPQPRGDADRRTLLILDDLAAALEIIRQTHRYVNVFKVGRANYVGPTKTRDWKQFTADVLDVLAETAITSRKTSSRSFRPGIQTRCGFLNTTNP